MKAPQIRYTLTRDGVRIAYTVYPGRGYPLLHLYAPGSPPLQVAHLVPSHDEWLGAINGDRPAVVFDYRGTGLSGPITGVLSIDQVVADIAAVTEAVGCEVDAISYNTACFGAVHYAATGAEGWRTLALSNPALSGRETMSRPLLDLVPAMPREMFFETLLRTTWAVPPTDISAVARAWARAVPASVDAYQQLFDSLDLRELLPCITIPTRVSAGRYMLQTSAAVAALIPGSVFATLPPAVAQLCRESGRASRKSLDQWYADLRLPSRNPAARPESAPPEVRARLTGREEEIVRLVAAGRSNSQIAETLGIAPATVARHIGNILNKTGLANRTQVAVYGAGHDLLAQSDHP